MVKSRERVRTPKPLLLAALAVGLAVACRRPTRQAGPPDAGPSASAPDAGALDGGPVPVAEPATSSGTFALAAGEPADLPVRFTCEVDGNEFRLGVDGRGSWRRPGRAARPIEIPLVDAGDVASVRCGSLADGALLVLGLADEKAFWGEVARLAGDPPAARWLAYLPGAPGGEPLLSGRHLYLAGSGIAGKLDVETGRWAWTHRGLPDAESPGRPELDGGVVTFPDASGPGLRADDETGVALPGAGADGVLRPGVAQARRLAALASAWFPGFYWRPSSFLELDLDGDDVPDFALLGTAPDMVAVVAVLGPASAEARHLRLLFHTSRPDEMQLRVERIQSPPSKLVCPVPAEPSAAARGARRSPAAPPAELGPECETYLRRRSRLAEMDDRGVRGVGLAPLGVHVFFDPEAGHLVHWGP